MYSWISMMISRWNVEYSWTCWWKNSSLVISIPFEFFLTFKLQTQACFQGNLSLSHILPTQPHCILFSSRAANDLSNHPSFSKDSQQEATIIGYSSIYPNPFIFPPFPLSTPFAVISSMWIWVQCGGRWDPCLLWSCFVWLSCVFYWIDMLLKRKSLTPSILLNLTSKSMSKSMSKSTRMKRLGRRNVCCQSPSPQGRFSFVIPRRPSLNTSFKSFNNHHLINSLFRNSSSIQAFQSSDWWENWITWRSRVWSWPSWSITKDHSWKCIILQKVEIMCF